MENIKVDKFTIVKHVTKNVISTSEQLSVHTSHVMSCHTKEAIDFIVTKYQNLSKVSHKVLTEGNTINGINEYPEIDTRTTITFEILKEKIDNVLVVEFEENDTNKFIYGGC